MATSLAVFPSFLRPDLIDQEPHALVVGRIQPEHAVEDAPSLLEPAKAPEAQPEPMHAAEERPVVDPSPRQHALEAFAKGQLADPEPRLIVTDRVLGPVVENEVAEVRVGIQATEVGLTEIHQDLVCTLYFTGVLAVIGFGDRVGKGILGRPPRAAPAPSQTPAADRGR